MKKLFHIIKREYLKIVKRKTFLISTVLTPLIMGALIYLPTYVAKISEEKQKNIFIIDNSKQIFSDLKLKLDRRLKDSSPAYKLEKIDSENKESTKENLKKLVEKDEIFAFIILPEDIIIKRYAEFYAKNVSDLKTINEIEDKLSNIISEKTLLSEGMNPEKVRLLIRKVSMKTVKIAKGEEKKSGFMSEYLGSIFFITILLTMILGYGQVIMNGVLEEKNNRIIEIMLSSVSSFQLMAGKIIGIGAAGITQLLIWISVAIYLLGGSSFLMKGMQVGFLDFSTMIYFTIFFLLGYFLYSTMFAAIGAISGTLHEAQQLMAPITYFLIIPFILGIAVAQNPNTMLATLFSLFPLFTPTLMFMRITFTPPPGIQIFISIVLLMIATLFTTWVSAKIFRTGILMYGKRPNFKEILRWIKAK
ncbi:MAG: ABC transporter permease [Acidobacteriota bacterium]